jgi:hypothetical protein
MKNNEGIMVQAYMPGELSRIYKISHPTFLKWIKSIETDIGERIGQYYTIRQVEIIFKNFGVPYRIEDKVVLASEF